MYRHAVRMFGSSETLVRLVIQTNSKRKDCKLYSMVLREHGLFAYVRLYGDEGSGHHLEKLFTTRSLIKPLVSESLF